MKRLLTHFAFLLVTVGVTFSLCGMAQREHQWFGGGIGPGGLLLWPAILLARAGMTRTWLLLTFAVLALLAVVAWSIRHRRLSAALALGVVLPVAYCLPGAFVYRHISVPLPKATPYDTDAKKRHEYLDTYDEGYRTGIAGTLRTYCFAPEHTTRGFYEGLDKGNEIFYRCLGIERSRRLIDLSARQDGVTLKSADIDTKPSPLRAHPK